MRDCGLLGDKDGDKDENKAGCMMTSEVQLPVSELEMAASDTVWVTALLFTAAVHCCWYNLAQNGTDEPRAYL